MQNRRFLLVLFVSALATLVLIVLLPLAPGMKTDPSAPWIDGLYKQKIAALRAVKGERIYVVSGSSSLFSLDTKLLASAAGKPVINLATHAGLELPYILDRAEREMQPGDTIIFTPEYPLMVLPVQPNQLIIDYVTFFDRAYIPTRPLGEQAHFYLGYGFVDSIVETLKTIRTGKQVGRDDLTIDALGNARGNTVALSVKDKSEFGPHGSPSPISPDEVAVLRKFAGLARARHVTILAFPPALIRLRGYETQGQRALRQHIRATFRDLGMTVRGGDEDGWVEPDGIYDSGAHANDVGRAAYTARIAVLLCREIRCAGR
ncbi:MAG: hypothetical protein H0U98_03325 [Alphaproteobacteria bacterium]|nr:hypothetical protein [Alphaproteobacteria bacterium]